MSKYSEESITAQDKMIQKTFYYFCPIKDFVGTHWNCLTEIIPMSTNKVHMYIFVQNSS